MSVFERCFAVVVGEEGSFGADPADPGNWTGGAVGAGTLAGTKYGISAAAFPDRDIEHLTLAEAQAIYRRDYWDHISGDALPAPLAFLVFDAAVNNGVERAARWLQASVGAAEDGAIGPETLASVAAHGAGAAACAEFVAQRMAFMSMLDIWRVDTLGLARRLAGQPWRAMTFAQPA